MHTYPRTRIAAVLAELMRARGIKSATALSKLTAIPQPTISRILNGTTSDPEDSTVSALATHFGVSKAQLRGEEAGTLFQGTEGAVLEPGPDITAPPKQAPVVGTAQAGDDGYWVELEHPVGHGDGWIDVPSRDPNAYSIRVRGDSMTPTIRDGWFIVVEPGHAVVPGEFVLVITKDGRSMVKELLFERADAVSLASINEAHPRLTLQRDEIRIMHYVGFIVPPSKHRM